MCVCERERERQRENEMSQVRLNLDEGALANEPKEIGNEGNKRSHPGSLASYFRLYDLEIY